MMARKIDESMIHGMVAPCFEKVKEVLIQNIKERNELGPHARFTIVYKI